MRAAARCMSACSRTASVEAAGALAALDVLIGDGAGLLSAAYPAATVLTPDACAPVLVAALGAADPPAPADPIYMRAAYA
jgi:hypothetical protein